MDISRWVASRPGKIREDGLQKTLTTSTNEIARFLLRKLDHYDTRAKPVYEKEWDVLILLDACRADLLSSVTQDYDFLPDEIPVTRSVASASMTWLNRTFIEQYHREMKETVYITANPYSRDLNSQDFQILDEVWKYGWDNEIGTVPPRNVTDRAIQTMRQNNPNRLILHYMQPHFPSIPDQLADGIDLDSFGEERASIWTRLQDGEICHERVWESYRENLRYVLGDIGLLLENMTSERVVISADHGNAFGRLGIFGHPPKIPIGALREVPWVETTATDTKQYIPSLERETPTVAETEARSRLEDLGYLL